MRIGPYRHRVNILTRTQGIDEYGAPLPDGWKIEVTVWAAIEPLKRGREYFASEQVQAEAVYDIRMRYIDWLTSDMRIQHGDTFYDIEAVLQDNRCRETIARCRLLSFEQYEQVNSGEDTSTTTTEQESEGW